MSADIDELKKRIADAKVVAVLGAGVSLGATGGAKVAGWLGLLENGVRRCRELRPDKLDDAWVDRQVAALQGDVGELVGVATQITRHLGGRATGDYAAWLQSTVGTLTAQHPQALEALRDLRVPVLTTNYDSLAEEVTGLRPITWRDKRRVERFLRGDERAVFHFHGHWEDPESVVLGYESYGDIQGNALAQQAIRALLTTKTLLYVGFGGGLEDPNFAALLKWVSSVYATSSYYHYRLARDGDVAAAQSKHPPEHRISVIGIGPTHEDLASFLRSLATDSTIHTVPPLPAPRPARSGQYVASEVNATIHPTDLAWENPNSTATTPAEPMSQNMISHVTESAANRRRKTVVISIHGIRTRGTWQKELVPILSDAGLTPEPLDYGNFWALALLVPFLRRRKVDWFFREYTRIVRKYPTASVSVIAHSFGTYLVARSLEKYGDHIRYDRIILCGSIVRIDFPWTDYLLDERIVALLNEFGRLDFWAWVVAYVVRDAGQAGRVGFDSAHRRLVQIEHPEHRHSDYFHPLNYERTWVPFLLGREISPSPKPITTSRNPRFGFVMVLIVLAVLIGIAIWQWPRFKQQLVGQSSILNGQAGTDAVQPPPSGDARMRSLVDLLHDFSQYMEQSERISTLVVSVQKLARNDEQIPPEIVEDVQQRIRQQARSGLAVMSQLELYLQARYAAEFENDPQGLSRKVHEAMDHFFATGRFESVRLITFITQEINGQTSLLGQPPVALSNGEKERLLEELESAKAIAAHIQDVRQPRPTEADQAHKKLVEDLGALRQCIVTLRDVRSYLHTLSPALKRAAESPALAASNEAWAKWYVLNRSARV